jgi:hypothetical protein
MDNYLFYFISGFVLGMYDVLFLSKPSGYLATAGRMLYFIGPVAAMGASFAATTAIACTLRGKDDRTNYVLGGISSAAILGAWNQCSRKFVQGVVIFGLAGYFKKKSIEEGWTFFVNDPSTRIGQVVDLRRNDYSTYKGTKYDN